jgi:hypothetical protein
VCLGHDTLNAHDFVPAHVDLVIRGLRRTQPATDAARPPAHKPARAPARRAKAAS